MATAKAKVEKILEEITALSVNEQMWLRQLMDRQPRKKEPLGKFVDPIPVPDQRPAMQWLSDHSHEYPDQWVALDGDRLIANGTDYKKVSAAAKASGVYLPMITFVESPAKYPFVRV
ncbi:MAG: DUF5678 domain-containing protein [Blastocatellia bacterium]